MSDYYRRSGEEGNQQQPYSTGAGDYPPPPPFGPTAPTAPTGPTGPEGHTAPATVWPGDGGAGYQPPGGVVQAGTPDAAPGPGHAPAPAPHRARAKRPVALLAAVALIAAVVGGGASALVQQYVDNGDTGSAAATSVTGTTVSQSSNGTVAGVAQAVSPSIVEINATSTAGEATGSGVIITSGGEIVTNNHVVSGADSIKVQLSDGKTYTAKLVGAAPDKDLALIKLEGASGLKAATLGDSSKVKVGDEVVAIGSPEGLTGTVTSGIVSALDRDVTVAKDEGQQQQQQQQQGGGNWPFEFGGQQFNGDTGSSKTTYKALQTDASLNPGNSGGALINMNGEIIGINSAMYSPSAASSSTAGSVGLGFAIPVNTVKSDLGSLRDGGDS
ncbi:trypsin-like peptidase domain-containing protein [Streptomyces sp. NPDC052236]|uniref:S1C family serine protease n=1 Tax=Streptomyces sp. NPDC052236 TaxID=3365686 RepID=UPI0037D52BD8